MADKTSRKELLKQEDAFLHAAAESANWLKVHRTPIIAAAVAVVVVIGAVWAVVATRESRRLEASRLFSAALDVKNAEIVPDASKAQPTATPPTFASAVERNKVARDAFQKVVDTAPGSGPAELARFYVGDLDATAGDVDKALGGFKTLATELAPDDTLYFLVIERTAYLLEQKGDVAGAMSTWQQLTSSTKRFYADHALFQLARLHADKGENDKARELLTRIEKDFPESPVMPKVQQLFAKVGRPEATVATGGDTKPAPKAP